MDFTSGTASPTFVARVSDLDIGRTQSGDFRGSLREMLDGCRVLVFPDQHLNHADLVRFARLFGEPGIDLESSFTVPGFPPVQTVSNIFENGEPIGIYDGDNEVEWHADQTFRPRIPTASMLYSVVAPVEGGATMFADTTAAFAALPVDRQEQLTSLYATHSLGHLDRRQVEHDPDRLSHRSDVDAPELEADHPLAHIHPRTGCRSLVTGSMVISRIAGMANDETTQLLDDLERHFTREQFVYKHQWSPGDVVVWDNWAVMHSASPCDSETSKRLLYRITVS